MSTSDWVQVSVWLGGVHLAVLAYIAVRLTDIGEKVAVHNEKFRALERHHCPVLAQVSSKP